MKIKALKAAFPYTLPICAGFGVLGMSYGLLMKSMGFSFLYPMFISLFVFAGSMQFVAVNVLVATFNPLNAFLLTLMVNARHIFYGFSLLEKYKNMGFKKIYMIFALCDETFSINCATTPPEGVDKGWFMFFVSMFNHFYWVLGSTLGGLLGYVLKFDTTGIEFVMTALFVVIFLNQWEENKDHKPALTGLACSIICLLIFGSGNFIIPAMLAIVGVLIFMSRKIEVSESAVAK